MSPLISAGQRDRVAAFVARAATAKHVEVTAGGRTRPGSGFFYEPTVVAGTQQSDEIVQREVFGPVVSVTRSRLFGVDLRRLAYDRGQTPAGDAHRMHLELARNQDGSRQTTSRPISLA